MRSAALLGPLGPFLRKTDDNPEGVPHAIGWTHAEQVNRELVAFLG